MRPHDAPCFPLLCGDTLKNRRVATLENKTWPEWPGNRYLDLLVKGEIMTNAESKQMEASPTWQYMEFKGYDKAREVDAETNVSNHDLLIAMLRSADVIVDELRELRQALNSS